MVMKRTNAMIVMVPETAIAAMVLGGHASIQFLNRQRSRVRLAQRKGMHSFILRFGTVSVR